MEPALARTVFRETVGHGVLGGGESRHPQRGKSGSIATAAIGIVIYPQGLNIDLAEICGECARETMIVRKTEPPHTSTTQVSGGVTGVSTRNQALGAW